MPEEHDAYELKFDLPNKQEPQWDSTHISKGVWSDYESQYTYVWALIAHCRHHKCPVFDKCKYCRGSTPQTCQAQSNYLRAVLNTAVHTAGTKCSRATMAMIGLELIPLYDQLFRLKLHTSNPRRLDPTYTTPNGARRVDPALKEMREVIKSIRQLWTHLEQMSVKKRARSIDPQRLGDQAYIDAMHGSPKSSSESDTNSDTDTEHPDPNADYTLDDEDAHATDEDEDPDVYEKGTGIDEQLIPQKSKRRRRSNKRRVRKQYWKKPGPKKRRGRDVEPYHMRKPKSNSKSNAKASEADDGENA